MVEFRKITKDDLYILNCIRNTYCKEFLHDSRYFTVNETKEWSEKTKPDYYIIFNDDIRIGYFRLSNYSRENRNIYVGADIDPNWTGKGLGYLAYIKFLPFLFEEYILNKVSLEVLSTNERAINLYKKLGFVIEGVKRQEVFKKDKYVDSIIMSILKEELKWKI